MRACRATVPCAARGDSHFHAPAIEGSRRTAESNCPFRSKRSAFITLVQAATKSCHELLARIGGRIDFRQARAAASSSRRRGRCASPSTSPRRSCGRCRRRPRRRVVDLLPRRAHVEQVDEEVVGELARPVGEDAVLRAAVVGAEHAQAADQHGHLRRAEAEQLGAVDQQLLGRHAEADLRDSCGSRRPWARAARSCRRRSAPRVASPRPAGERHGDVVAGVLRRLLDRRPSRRARSGRRARPCRRNRPGCAHRPSTLASSAGSLTSQSFCGARRMRAPLAPPRLSEPRKVEAEAQAVLTSWPTREARLARSSP